MPGRRAYATIFVLALIWGALLAAAIQQPGYTDAYYYFNAGQRLAQGDGLTDPYLWIYINAPDKLPGPSHTYWMPLESLVAAVSMKIAGATFGAAQIPSVLCFAGLVTLSFWTGAHLGRSRRHAWIAGWLVLFSGFYTPFWTTTDTFALYGLVGALALAAMGRGRATGNWRWYAFGGAMSGLAHLTRADGVLLVIVLVLVAFWPKRGFSQLLHGGISQYAPTKTSHEEKLRAGAIHELPLRAAVVGVVVYLLVMLPWFVRNMAEIGTPLPTGGTQTIWLRGYNELVNYPPGASAGDFFDWGLGNILQSRWEALTTNLGTFIAVETWVILGPFVLFGLWLRRRDPFLLGVMLYALGLHLAMTFVFSYPGYRGGLFHSAAALLPFWASVGLIGLDEAIIWAAKRRRWPRTQAQTVFGGALVVLVVVLSVGMTATRFSGWNENGAFYRTLAKNLDPDAGAVLMVNDPAALYYHTGLSGVVVPNADPDVVPEIAAKYGVTYLVLDVNRTDPFTGLFLGAESRPFLQLHPDWPHDQGTADQADDIRVFEIIEAEGGE